MCHMHLIFSCCWYSRKKRLTSHWRTFIQPLMWRCKWVELQIKKFQSQAKKYDTKLAEMNQRKLCRLENLKSEGIGGKSLPFSNNCRREKVMQRKKRKRVEDTMDAATYMSHHNMFSYYGTNFFYVLLRSLIWLLPCQRTRNKSFLLHSSYMGMSMGQVWPNPNSRHLWIQPARACSWHDMHKPALTHLHLL